MKRKTTFWFCTAALSLLIQTNALPGQQSEDLRLELIKYAGHQAVSGRESQFVDFLKSQLPKNVRTATDSMGNLIAEVGEGEPDILVVASIDEPGYLVTKITEEGYLMVQTPSGAPPSTLFHQFHEGHLVDIATQTGTVKGIVAIPSSHIFRGSKEDLGIDDILIDVGARSSEEATARGIQTLDPVTAVKDHARLANDRVAGPMLSRKFPAFAVMKALQTLDATSGKNAVFAWTTQGLRRNSGVARIAEQYRPKNVLLIQAFQRLVDRRTGVTKDPVDVLGSGLLIPENAGAEQSAIGLLRRVTDAALKSGLKTTASSTGAPGELQAFAQSHSAVVPLAVPVMYPGTLVEVVDVGDLEELIECIRMVVETN